MQCSAYLSLICADFGKVAMVNNQFINTNNIRIDPSHLTSLIQNSAIVRLVSILGNTNLSVLELIECGLTTAEIDYAFSNSVIEYLRIPSINESKVQNLPLSYDTYYYSVRKQIKLTDLGLYILENITPTST